MTLAAGQLGEGQINAPALGVGADVPQDVGQLEGLAEVDRVVAAGRVAVAEDLDAQQADDRGDAIAVEFQLLRRSGIG